MGQQSSLSNITSLQFSPCWTHVNPIFWACSCGKSCTVMTGSQEISTCFEGIIQPLAALVMAISNPPLASLYYVYIYIYTQYVGDFHLDLQLFISIFEFERLDHRFGSLDLSVQLKFHRSSWICFYSGTSHFPWHLTNQSPTRISLPGCSSKATWSSMTSESKAACMSEMEAVLDKMRSCFQMCQKIHGEIFGDGFEKKRETMENQLSKNLSGVVIIVL